MSDSPGTENQPSTYGHTLTTEDLRDNVWYVPFNTSDLLSAYEPRPDIPVIAAAQPFTVALRSIRVEDNPQTFWDKFVHGNNDVLVMSNAVLGTKPLLQRVHYYADQLPIKTVVNNFMAETMYVCEDYSGMDHLWLEVQIVAAAADPQNRQALVSKFNALASQAGSIFPVVMPYTLVSEGVLKIVENFLDASTQNKDILRCPVTFNPAGHGYPLLRPGCYVVFPHPVPEHDYKLASNLKLIRATGEEAQATYAVFVIDNTNAPMPDYVASQRVATLLTQLDQGNQNADQASIGFLTDTLTLYSNYKDLQRYLELKTKPSLTDDEKKLMERLAQRPELQPFLPK